LALLGEISTDSHLDYSLGPCNDRKSARDTPNFERLLLVRIGEISRNDRAEPRDRVLDELFSQFSKP